MKTIALRIRNAALSYLKWGWPVLLADTILESRFGQPANAWRSTLNFGAFLWILCSPVAPLTFLLDRQWRDRATGRLFGFRDGDERERTITSEAAQTTLLLGLSLQGILLVLSLVSVRLSWDPNVPKGEKHGLLSVGMGFSSSRHLNPFGSPLHERPSDFSIGAVDASSSEIKIAGGFLLAPSTFPVLAFLILIEVVAFKMLSSRRYAGFEP